MFAQDKMIAKTGKITFEASVPSFEEVTAINHIGSCLLNSKTGEIACLVLVKGFRFKLALMEEHFNENYIESNDYPKATFKGIIQGFNSNIIGTTPKQFKMKGKLEIHGKKKEIDTNATLRKTDGGIEIISDFNVNSDEFAIVIPSVVSWKVAKTVNIKTEFLVK
ncbi:hypothetical protein DB895_07175 [Flavobacterium psychrotolerans]|uniref:Lipid/polyisoprenoid-binding YceI-like domain-containing protein n=2 Tax=Flavobacterium psychrotolerans TaxID=2169410 RepID=A0A2U1JJM5_9FLAO|nr:hypothetical protein DB895_07175 [Flavobacterium psychrotolerans]